jgi:hypothetical protein
MWGPDPVTRNQRRCDMSAVFARWWISLQTYSLRRIKLTTLLISLLCYRLRLRLNARLDEERDSEITEFLARTRVLISHEFLRCKANVKRNCCCAYFRTPIWRPRGQYSDSSTAFDLGTKRSVSRSDCFIRKKKGWYSLDRGLDFF